MESWVMGFLDCDTSSAIYGAGVGVRFFFFLDRILGTIDIQPHHLNMDYELQNKYTN